MQSDNAIYIDDLLEKKNDRSEWLTIDELSAWLKINKKTLYHWAQERKIPRYKIHGLVRFEKSKIEAWAKKFYQKSKTQSWGYYTSASNIDFIRNAIIMSQVIKNNNRGV